MKNFKIAFISANISLIFVGVFLVQSCSKDTTKAPQQTTCNLPLLTYTNDIKAIFDNNCTSCHGSIRHENNVDLSNYGNTKSAIEKYDIICSMKFEPGCVGMPTTGKIEDSIIHKVECWINSNSPN